MAALNQSGEEPVECPLCMEPLEVDDLNFYPCTCGYQICRFCWNRIREGENGLCPACRKAYPENPADFTPLSREQVAAIKTEKRSKEQRKRNKTLESRRQLANVRVVQKNLVFVVGLPVRLADPEVLKKQEYFGKYGKIHKVVINQSTAYAGAQLNGPSASAYVTYLSSADALRAIQSVNNVSIDGRVLKGSLGTTKYCANFMKNQPCPKLDCMYLHDLGDPKASFTKEEMHQGLHQVYERKLHNQLIASMANGGDLEKGALKDGSISTNGSSNSSTSNSYMPVQPSSSITILNSNQKDSGLSNSSVSSQCSSDSAGSLSGSGATSTLAAAAGQLMNGTREAWPSLSSSPDHKNESSPNDLQNHSPEPEYRTSQSDTADSSIDKDVPSDDSRDNYLSEEGVPRNSHSTDVPSVFESRRPFSSHIGSNNDNDSLIDSDEHRLLDDDTHNLLDTSQNHRNIAMPHQLGPAFHSDTSRLSHMLAHRPKLNSSMLDYEQLLRQQRHQTDLISQQQQQKSQSSDTHLVHSHNPTTDVMQNFFTQFTIGQQMKRQNVNVSPPHMPAVQNSLPPLPTDVPTHAFIESQHLQRRYGQGHGHGHGHGHNTLNNGHIPMPQQQQMNHSQPQLTQLSQIEQMNQLNHINQLNQMNQLRQMMGLQMGNSQGQIPNLSTLSTLTAQMSNLTTQMANMSNMSQQRPDSLQLDDDLDFDPFKETQKAFADLMENDIPHRGPVNLQQHSGVQQNGISGFNPPMARNPQTAMAPPPGFHSHMNAFGLGVPRPQASQPHQNSLPHTDWTQMDPAIVSTSVSQSQQREAFARFANLGMPPPPPQQAASKRPTRNGHPAMAGPVRNGFGPLGGLNGLNGANGPNGPNGLNGHYQMGRQPQCAVWPECADTPMRAGFYAPEAPNKISSVPPGFSVPSRPARNDADCIESK